jgi:hypothetical protein
VPLKNGHPSDTSNIGHTRHRTKIHKQQAQKLVIFPRSPIAHLHDLTMWEILRLSRKTRLTPRQLVGPTRGVHLFSVLRFTLFICLSVSFYLVSFVFICLCFFVFFLHFLLLLLVVCVSSFCVLCEFFETAAVFLTWLSRVNVLSVIEER